MCATEEPQLREIAPGHFVACHHPLMDSPVAVVSAPTASADEPAGGGSGRGGMIRDAAVPRTAGHRSTRLIFRAAALGGMSQERADDTLAAMSGWGINHIDTAAATGRPRTACGRGSRDSPRRGVPRHQDG